ncbi:hypothetical protein BGX34_007947 [Mortierella sp. NVP85]|nr:hypothetical protein BGX34_007947 [Mortierella sp. NVP85]
MTKQTRLGHSRGSLFVLSTKSTGVVAATAAISFMEAPVKFLAPTPARRGLIDVGRHVFSALNKVEVILAAFDILGWYLVTQRGLVVPLVATWTAGSSARGGGGVLYKFLGSRRWLRFVPGVVVYVFQSFTFLPMMRNVGARYIEGRPVESGKTHGVYVALELIKVIALAASTAGIARALLQRL